MRTAEILACCLLVFPLVGTVSRSGPRAKTQSLASDKEAPLRRAPFDALLREASLLYQSGRYHEALQGFEAARVAAVKAQLPRQAARALGNIGGCQFALHQYRPALQSFLEAHRHAEIANDPSAAAIFDVNIASLYSELGELDAASEWIQGTIKRLNDKDRTFLPQILIQLATLRARQDRMPEARQLFNQGIEAADRAADLSLYANGLEPSGRGIPEARRTGARRGSPARGLPGPQVEPPGAGCLVSQPRTFTAGARRSGFGRGAARPRSGTVRAAAGVDSDVGHLSLPRARSHGSGTVARCHGTTCGSRFAWRASGVGTRRPTMPRGWEPKAGWSWFIRPWSKPATGCIWKPAIRP